MTIPHSRRDILKGLSIGGLQLAFPALGRASICDPLWITSKGNPIIPDLGVCDPQVRVYDDQVYLYATHDASPENKGFVMHNWWVWHTVDLVHWDLVSVLKPEQTYFKKPSSSCWATDAARRDGKYFFYFSMGPKNIGVVQGNSPAGPWHDPLGKALIAEGSVNTQARDPGILQEPNGETYLVFGTFNYYIARLKEDMISLAEKPRLIQVNNAVGPYGKGKTDDKPFMQRRGNKYYLSWGCYYGISDSPYGPFDCKGSFIEPDRVAPSFKDISKWGSFHKLRPQSPPRDWLRMDRHGSFFKLYGQWYFICNDQSQPGSSHYFRNSIISYIRYKDNGEIDPIWITPVGVGQYDAHLGMAATDFFKTSAGRVRETADGSFEVRNLGNNSYLVYPNVRNLQPQQEMSIRGRQIHPAAVEIEVRRRRPEGMVLGSLKINPQTRPNEATFKVQLRGVKPVDDLCLVFKGGNGELIRLKHLSFT